MATSRDNKRNRDRREYQRQWRKANREHLRKTNLAYKLKNRDRIRAHYAANKAKILQKHREWEAKNREYLREQHRKWKIKNPERAEMISFKSALKMRYGMTVELYDALLRAQGGRCASCRRKETMRHKSGKIYRLAVDHSHKTGRVRGLLCCACNKTIGLLSAKHLRGAADYLDRVGR